MRVKRIPVDLQMQQMSGALSSYVTLPAAPWEEADDIRSPKQRARDMRRQGMTCEQIGRVLGVSEGVIQRETGGVR